ncbi:hypothetical protein [Bacillus sp. 179-C3.3 HS]|uniref:hypothetical protein n=1 Tax=Bacillus sp. 179-C3.3 HS TaxID=3232162 RepID=UPI0039A1FC49
MKVGQAKIEIAVDDDTIYNYFIAENDRKIGEMVNKVADRNNYQLFTKQEIKNGLDTIVLDPNDLKQEIDVSLVEKYEIEMKKAFIKIAFELGYYWIGKDYLKDPIAKLISGILENPIKANNEEQVSCQINNLYQKESYFEDTYENYYHLGALFKDDYNNIRCIIRIFDLFDANIVICKQATKYNISNKFLSVNSITGKVEEKDF